MTTTVQQVHETYKKTIPVFRIVKDPTTIQSAKVVNSKEVADYMRQFWDDGSMEVCESFYMITLNRANNITGYTLVSKGGISGTVVDVRIICKYAIENLCSGVIVAHNHPSGNLNFSQADINISKKLKEALKIMDIDLLDSLVLTEESYRSMADNGIL